MDLDAAQVNARCSQVLDYASDSESDVEPAMLDSVWRAQDHESSDAESVDSQAEDPLKYVKPQFWYRSHVLYVTYISR